jgi:hypothetical protein
MSAKSSHQSSRQDQIERFQTSDLPWQTSKNLVAWWWHRKVDIRLPGKGNSRSHRARPVHQIMSMMKWIQSSRLSIKNSLSGGGRCSLRRRSRRRGSTTNPPTNPHVKTKLMLFRPLMYLDRPLIYLDGLPKNEWLSR